MQWFRQSFRIPMNEGDISNGDISNGDFAEDEIAEDEFSSQAPDMDMMEEIADEMRQQIRWFQEQIDELKSPATPAVDNALEGGEQAPAKQPDQVDVSNIDGTAPGFATLVQYDGRRRFPSGSRYGSGSRYDNRAYRGDYNRYRGGYRSDFGNRAYHTYPNRYYNYGGRPFYYGGGYPYGYRGGVRIGPNLGIWW